MSATLTTPARSILRYSRWDALLVGLAMAHGFVLLVNPSFPVISLGLWWNSNTISHNFIHLPFFRSRTLNRLFSYYLSLLLGYPHTLWRERHLAHHRGTAWRVRLTGPMAIELGLVLALWIVLVAVAPTFYWTVYLPGYLVGIGLCYLQGYYEHVRGPLSHYGALYNLPFFNDGYHVEHHERPGEHWTRLPQRFKGGANTSRWPAILRWVDAVNLELLERWVLHSRSLQRFVLKKHESAFRVLLSKLPPVRQVEIIGGGLFPRTALILQRLLPCARLIVIDKSDKNLKTAQAFLQGNVEFVHDFYQPSREESTDLVVVPLAYVGDRAAIYRRPPAPAVLVHDWIWHRDGAGVNVSYFLLKRLNLVRQ